MDKSEYANMYHLESNFWWYKVLHELVGYIITSEKPASGYQILDAGCGTGRVMEIMQKYGTVTGIDFSEEAVHFARKRGLSNVIQEDLNDFIFDNQKFDAIICLDVLYHEGINNDLKIVRKFYGTLKQGGILILNLPAFEYLRRSHDIIVQTKRRYRKKTFIKDLEESGFSIVKASYRMPLLYFVILISKLSRRKDKSKNSESDLKELPGWLNKSLLNIGRIENWWIKKGFSFQVGSSLFIVAKKQA